ncbi:MAG TPA: ABC transporter ATP-binding protein [Thermoplasmata archaeon]
MPSSEGLVVREVGVSWAGRPVLHEVSLSIAPGEFVTLMGPNGSGKTTLLRAIAGFEPLDAGSVTLAGRELTRLPPHRRGIGLLFQDPTLLPRRTVWENVAFGPEVQGLSDDEVARRVREALGLLRLDALAGRRSEALSGGERQRVALARTLAARPGLVLLDEPFASVDPELRSGLRAEFRRVLRGQGISVLHVTHDREEGLFLGDRVLLLDGGRLLQSGTPDGVFHHPRNVAAARFLGYNVVRAGGRSVAVHPTELRLGPPESGGEPATVLASGPVGGAWVAYLESPGGARWEVRSLSGELPAAGESVTVRWTRSIPVEE